MSGPGDVIAGLAPPQENVAAAAYRGRKKRRGGDREGSAMGDAWSRSAGEEVEAARGEDERAAEAGADQPAAELSALAGYIRSSWARNKRARDLVEERLLACLRARRGVYCEAELQEMWTADAGEPIYLPLAATKMRAAEAALRELLLPEGERPWGLDPSPLPELPPEVMAPLLERAGQMARQQMQQAAARGERIASLSQFTQTMVQLHERLKDETLAQARVEAKARAARMEDVIEERMERGGYYSALAEYVQHFCTYPAAVLKGPFLRRGKRLAWTRPGQPDVVSAPELAWAAVNPFDCYPAPEAQSCQDGDFIERIPMTPPAAPRSSATSRSPTAPTPASASPWRRRPTPSAS